MKRLIPITLFVAVILVIVLVVTRSTTQGFEESRSIRLFDETKIEHTTGPVMPEPIIKKTTTVEVTFHRGMVAILSSTPDGWGVPNVDDLVAINGERVQGGEWIPNAVRDATGVDLGGDAEFGTCIDGTSVSACSFPTPHDHPVDVSRQIPWGTTEVKVDLLDFGGAFGNTEMYLVIFQSPHDAP